MMYGTVIGKIVRFNGAVHVEKWKSHCLLSWHPTTERTTAREKKREKIEQNGAEDYAKEDNFKRKNSKTARKNIKFICCPIMVRNLSVK